MATGSQAISVRAQADLVTERAARGGPVRNPFPVPQRLLYRLYWRGAEIASWRARETNAGKG